MQAGELRHRLTIEQNTGTPDAAGGTQQVWGAYATVWGQLEPLSGAEYFSAQQYGTAISHRVTIRFKSGVTPKMRVLFGSRKLNIEAVLNESERNRMLTLMCQEVSRENV